MTDNGVGFKKENYKRIFERFFRVDRSGSRSAGGSGLGLAIVKHIIDAHDEKIYVESEFGVRIRVFLYSRKIKIVIFI